MALTGIIQNDLPLPENRKPKKQAGLGRVGFIKVGEKRKGKNGKEYPVSLDYFRCHADKAYQEQFTQALGEKPNRIQISFLSNDPAHACNARYELRDKCGKLYCQSDGQTFKVSAGEQWTMISLPEILNKYETLENFMEKASAYCESTQGWQMALSLRFVIPAIQGLLAEWQFDTKGAKTSIAQIVSTWHQVKQVAGTVQMVPFDLVVNMVTSQRSGSKSKYPVVNLIPNASLENLETINRFIESGADLWKAGLLTADRLAELQEGKNQIKGLNAPDKN